MHLAVSTPPSEHPLTTPARVSEHPLTTLLLQAFNRFLWDHGLYRQADGSAYPSGAIYVNQTNAAGKQARYITTPAVLREVRELSGCATLTGAPLEDEGGSGTLGGHWEMALFEVRCPEALLGMASHKAAEQCRSRV
jgi:hypothetical protein